MQPEIQHTLKVETFINVLLEEEEKKNQLEEEERKGEKRERHLLICSYFKKFKLFSYLCLL